MVEQPIKRRVDLGADIAATAEQLVEFAIMGQAFARVVNGVANPRVALLNIGSEELKGHESIREAARLLRASKLAMDFRGFIEADKIGYGEIDVVVTDGFTGNVALKTAEGIAKMISDMLRDALKSGPVAMLGALLVLPALSKMRAKMDPRKTNGGVFLGGPPLVKAATGEVATDEELGGAVMHTGISGLGEYLAEDDADGIRIARDVLVDYARQRNAQRRGDGAPVVSLFDTQAASEVDAMSADELARYASSFDRREMVKAHVAKATKAFQDERAEKIKQAP